MLSILSFPTACHGPRPSASPLGRGALGRGALGRAALGRAALGRATAAALLAWGLFAPVGWMAQAAGSPAQDGAGETAEESFAPRLPQRYLRAAEDGAVLRNLAGGDGLELIRVPADTLLAVHDEDAGWVGVDVPGGFPVWVFGRYLQATETPGVLEVTGRTINMRPMAGRDVVNYQIPERLHKGDRVTLIRLEDSAKPLAETWVQVWSPQGAYGWVQGGSTVPLERDVDAEALWAAAEQELTLTEGALRLTAEGAQVGVLEAAVSLPTSPAGIALAAAADRMAEEVEKSIPDFDAVRAAIGATDGMELSLADETERARLLKMLRVNEDLYRTASQLEQMKLERRREIQRQQAQRLQEIRPKDPQLGRFDLRGRLEMLTDADGARTFSLRQGGRSAAELRCTTGRYDLERYVGCDLGLIVEPIEEAETLPRELVLVDLRRLEVLASASSAK